MKTRMPKIAIALATMLTGAVMVLSATAFAAAAGGPNDPSGPAPKSVSATSRGMPSTSRVLYATINADGSIAHNLGLAATGTQRLGQGTYQVIFANDMQGCAYVATIGNAGAGTALQGTVDVALRAGNNSGVFVETKDLAGAFQDRPFHLVVTC